MNSVDAKKTEKIGDFKNNGRPWRQQAVDVNIYDFPSLARGKAIPYASMISVAIVDLSLAGPFAIPLPQRW